MRKYIIAVSLLFATICPAFAYVSIGINLNAYPTLVPVAGSPVYYVPGMSANYFYSNGVFWVFQNDAWYSSVGYNGPWAPVAIDVVPAYILTVPVRYYARPPYYFHGWMRDAAPRWDVHWGPSWAARHGWDHGMPPRVVGGYASAAPRPYGPAPRPYAPAPMAPHPVGYGPQPMARSAPAPQAAPRYSASPAPVRPAYTPHVSASRGGYGGYSGSHGGYGGSHGSYGGGSGGSHGDSSSRHSGRR